MKKMLIAMAICAGVFLFANGDFAEASDQQATDSFYLTSGTTADTQQMSSKRDDDD